MIIKNATREFFWCVSALLGFIDYTLYVFKHVVMVLEFLVIVIASLWMPLLGAEFVLHVLINIIHLFGISFLE